MTKRALKQRRRSQRFFLDVDWFVESNGCSTLGRGVELSVRGALLPISCQSPFAQEVTLFLSLRERPRMFKAKGTATLRPGAGWVVEFTSVAPEDLRLLGEAIIAEYGERALPEPRPEGRGAEL